MRNTRSSSNTSWTISLSSRAVARSDPKGFSITTRARSASPLSPSMPTISPIALGGTER